MEVDLIQAVSSDTDQMASLWVEAFEAENSNLTQLMYAGVDMLAGPMLENILTAEVNSEDTIFVICYDLNLGTAYEEDWPPVEELANTTFGWISVGNVPDAITDGYSYVVNDFSVYVGGKLQAREARARGENLSIDNPRFRLICEITQATIGGQARYCNGAYLVVNALVLYPEGHEDQTWEMAFKLLGWAINYSERCDLPIWTQIPVNQMGYFREAGFREVASFRLNLNDYAPHGSTRNLGTQEWLQMVYHAAPRARRARSVSPRNTDGRRRRLTF